MQFRELISIFYICLRRTQLDLDHDAITFRQNRCRIQQLGFPLFPNDAFCLKNVNAMIRVFHSPESNYGGNRGEPGNPSWFAKI